MRRLKPRELPIVRRKLYDKAAGVCPLCKRSVDFTQTVLDHDHATGLLRGILCRNCNGIEGRIRNLVTRGRAGAAHDVYLGALLEYWRLHATPQWPGIYHPTHKTTDEKRLLVNKRARVRRKKAATKGS